MSSKPKKPPKRKRLPSYASIGEVWLRSLVDKGRIRNPDSEFLRKNKMTAVTKKRNSKVLSTRITLDGNTKSFTKIIKSIIENDPKLFELRENSKGIGGAKIIFEKLRKNKQIKRVETELVEVSKIITGLIEVGDLSGAEKATDSFRGKNVGSTKEQKIKSILKKKPILKETSSEFEKEQLVQANLFRKRMIIAKSESEKRDILEEFIIEMDSLADEFNIFGDSKQKIKVPSLFKNDFMTLPFSDLKNLAKSFNLDISIKTPAQISMEISEKQSKTEQQTVLPEEDIFQRDLKNMREQFDERGFQKPEHAFGNLDGILTKRQSDVLLEAVLRKSTFLKEPVEIQGRLVRGILDLLISDFEKTTDLDNIPQDFLNLIKEKSLTDSNIVNLLLKNNKKEKFEKEIKSVEAYTKKIIEPSDEFIKIQNKFKKDSNKIRELIDDTILLASKVRGQENKIDEIKQKELNLIEKFDIKMEELRIQSIVNFEKSQKPGIDFTLPYMNYAGPGTRFSELVNRGVNGIHRIDEITKDHDSDYNNAKTGQDVRIADERALRNIKRVIDEGIGYGVYEAGEVTRDEKRDAILVSAGLTSKIEIEDLLRIATLGQYDPRTQFITIKRMTKNEIEETEQTLNRELNNYNDIIQDLSNLDYDFKTKEEQRLLKKINDNIVQDREFKGLNDFIDKISDIVESSENVEKDTLRIISELLTFSERNPQFKQRIDRDIREIETLSKKQKIDFIEIYEKQLEIEGEVDENLILFSEKIITSLKGLEPNELAGIVEETKTPDIVEETKTPDITDEIITVKMDEIEPTMQEPPLITKDPDTVQRETGIREIARLFIDNEESIGSGSLNDALEDLSKLSKEESEDLLSKFENLKRRGLTDEELVFQTDLILVGLVPPEQQPDTEQEEENIIIDNEIKKEDSADPTQGREPLLRPEFIILGSESVEEPKSVSLNDIIEWTNFNRELQINPNSIQNPLWDDTVKNLNMRFDEPLNKLVFKFKQPFIPNNVSKDADIEDIMINTIPQEQPFRNLFVPENIRKTKYSDFTRIIPSNSYKNNPYNRQMILND